MASRIDWLKLKFQELFHVKKKKKKKKKAKEEEKTPKKKTPLIELKPSIELAMILIEVLLLVYLFLGLNGFVSLF